MKNSKVGFSKDEVKEINRFGFERDLWWRAKITLLNSIASLKLQHNNAESRLIRNREELLALIDKGLWQPL